MCGEKSGLHLRCVPPEGSPPLVRGKAPGVSRARFALGITPACAGKSICFTLSAAASRDHPRLCGEKLIMQAVGELIEGSPPLVRGKVAQRHTRLQALRITPACAGKRRLVAATRLPGQDHPRLCGEKGCFEGVLYPVKGSPPLVRGKADRRKAVFLYTGITPACAGKRRPGRVSVV